MAEGTVEIYAKNVYPAMTVKDLIARYAMELVNCEDLVKCGWVYTSRNQPLAKRIAWLEEKIQALEKQKGK
jgi:Zn ribbon nucleic-acid-binding protein